jgi:aspartyl/asparaginyl-tRNA synthetase
MINMFDYSHAVGKMREFFVGRGFVEVPIQSRLSILAACEDPSTVGQFKFTNVVWPLPQTGQMWLEYEILKNPGVPGVFCITTSYRDEPNPIAGRHERIFPMFEFESHGGINELQQLEKDLLSHLGFTSKQAEVDYEKAAAFYKTDSLEAEHEMKMSKDYAPITFLKHFPGRTSPFWNMKQLDSDRYAKIDVIAHGQETIGSAERSCNVEEMRHNFHTISDGQYAKLLYKLFSKERVESELEAYLKLPMIPRFGAGIGVTRMIRAMKMEGLLESNETAGEQQLSPVFA